MESPLAFQECYIKDQKLFSQEYKDQLIAEAVHLYKNGYEIFEWTDEEMKWWDKSNEDNVEQMKSVLEEYANGGLEIILDKIHVHPENTFDILKILIDQELQAEIPDEIDQDLSWGS